MGTFNNILILLGCSVVIISICRRLHLPLIIGYLLVGILVGPGGLRWLPRVEDMQQLAEFGVVFLMFTLGLEFSIPRLIAARKILLEIGGLQVLICTAIGTIIAIAASFTIQQAIIIGGALALSSTAVIIKQLNEQKEQNTEHGHLLINILLLQDIMAIFFLILVAAIPGGENESLPLTFVFTVLKGVTAIVVMIVIGRWVLRPLFHEVAKAHSTELFMIATILVALSTAGITHYLELSMTLGSFLAGLLLGETEFKHQIDLDIRPFRDVLLGLFFVIIGAYLELDQLPMIWQQVLLILFLLFIIKTVITALIAKLLGNISLETAFKTSIILAHGGEFSFVILQEAIDNRIMTPQQQAPIFAAVVISIMFAPLIIRFNKHIFNFIRAKDNTDELQYAGQLVKHTAELQQHVILCGFGRVGQILARFLDKEKIPWLALDLDPTRISKISITGENAFYGDATNPHILTAAGLAKARMLVISFSNENNSLTVISCVRNMRLDLPIFVRTKDDTNLEKLQAAGATEIVPETLEGSLMLASHLLLALGFPTTKIISRIKNIHADKYETIRGIFTGADEPNILEEKDNNRRSLHSIIINESSAFIDKPLGSLISSDLEITIKSITRDATRYDEPNSTMLLEARDVLVVFSTPEQAFLIEEKILQKSN